MRPLPVDTRTDMSDDWELIGYVIASRYRKLVINELSAHPSTPSQLAERTDASIASISHALSQFREQDCVEILVDEERHKGRVYGLTETGEEVWEHPQEEQMP